MDKVQDNIEKIRNLFPNAVTEVIDGYVKDENGDEKPIIKLKVDFDVLKQELADTLIDERELRYQFTWPDKQKSILLANTSVAKTLRPDKEKSVDFDNTQNLYIEGDNLDVLKLLRETYLGKIKMIYIDPPYNTGNDFVYEDDFAIEGEEYKYGSGQYDEERNRLFQNTESNGRFHTDWLNMIYPRLKVAKDLLTDDGVIFISIDDNEVENLIKIGDEIFGRNNRVGIIIVKSNPRGSMSEAELAYLHEYLLVYSKSMYEIDILGSELSDSMKEEYKYKDEFGNYRLLGLRMRGGFWRKSQRPNLYFPIYINPKTGAVSLTENENFNEVSYPIQPSTMEAGTWRWSKEKIEKDKHFLIGKQVKRNDSLVWDIFQKDYQERVGGRKTKVTTIWEESEVNYQNGTVEIKNLFNATGIFNYSKPVFLIKKAIAMSTNEDSLVLDFFSGSATTAHAVMQLNAEDGGNRKFIMVQLPEPCDEKSEAYKAGYKTICEIGEERIRRAGKQIVEEKAHLTNAYKSGALQLEMAFAEFTNSDQAKETQEKIKKHLDIGFRVLRLDSSNMREVYYHPEKYTQTLLDALTDNIKEDRTPLDLLFQVMLDLGVKPSAKIEEKEIAGKRVYVVNENELIACFDNEITDEVVTAIAKRKPLYAAFRDSSYASDSVAANFEQIFATYSPKTIKEVL